MNKEEYGGEEDSEQKLQKMKQVECEYCGKIVELANIVRLNPETERYEYACENCARKLELDVMPKGDTSYFL
jgi:DNA-directed RNA polymerase subunit RPC12/RpoP